MCNYAHTDTYKNCEDEESRKQISIAVIPALMLSTTYRCGKAIVALANSIVPDYCAAESAPEGEVKAVSEETMITDARGGDFILSRTNAPLIKICMSFLKQKRKATIQGKDIGKGLLWMIKKSETVSVDGFLDWLTNWQESETARLSEKNKDTSAIKDKTEVLQALCEDCRSLSEVRNNIEMLFDDVAGANEIITLSTVHKVKGLEADRVWMLMNTFKKSNQEELNIEYVAITRSRHSLFLVGAAGLPDPG